MAKQKEQSWLERWGGTFTGINTEEVEKPTEVLPTGCLGLDMALGVGGLPVGHITRIEGLPGSYKTTLTQKIAVNAIAAGKTVYWLDTEVGFEPKIAVLNGLPVDDDMFRLWQFNPEDAPENILCYENMAKFFVQTMKDKTNNPNGCLFVVDSYSMLATKSELDGILAEGDLGDTRMANQAYLDAKLLKILPGYLKSSNSLLVVLQEVRANIASPYGGTTASGSYALRHGAWVHMKLKRVADGQIHVEIPKNKSFRQNMETDFFYYEDGVDSAYEIVELGKKFKVVTQSGAFYKINGENLQGKAAVRAYFAEHPDVAEQLREQIMEAARA